MKKILAGFTLIEMSIVLIVISLILAGVLKTVGVQRQQLKRDETRQQLETIKEALIGFALTHGRLPCPDTGTDGIENPQDPANNVSCDADEGWLPHVDLGTGSADTWGSRFRYFVTGSGVNSFADAPPSLVGTPVAANSSFSVDSTSANPAVGDITVNDVNGNSIAIEVPAMVISFGENGRQTISPGFPCPVAYPSSVEDENCNGDKTLVDSFYSDVGGQEYDDLVIWIPLTVLKSRMIEAALLP